MNSLQKNTTSQGPSLEDYCSIFEKKLSQMTEFSEVEKLLLKLQFLGNNYDPFFGRPEDECQQIVENLNLIPHLQNPYEATNIILRLLDKTEERLNTLKQ
jgi:hypothetical protein